MCVLRLSLLNVKIIYNLSPPALSTRFWVGSSKKEAAVRKTKAEKLQQGHSRGDSGCKGQKAAEIYMATLERRMRLDKDVC